MNITFLAIIAITFLMGSAPNADAAPQLLKVSDRRPVEFGRFVDELGGVDVIFLGETHDARKQHAEQLEIIRALRARKIPVAIGMEMFATDSQPQLDDWTGGKIDEREFTAIYRKNWSFDWELYREIFLFARDNRIPMVALNVPQPIIAKVVRRGSAALDDSDRKAIPPDTSWTLNQPQTEYLRRITRQVFRNKPVPISFDNFREAQALRNQAIAWNIAKFRERSPKTTVVVITGTWHAIKNGAPAELKRYGTLRYRVILPELPELSVQDATPGETDYLMLK